MSCSSVLSDIILSVFLTLDTQATKQIISQTDWRKAKKEKILRIYRVVFLTGPPLNLLSVGR